MAFVVTKIMIFFTHGGKVKNLLEETSQFHGYKTFKYIVKMLSF